MFYKISNEKSKRFLFSFPIIACFLCEILQGIVNNNDTSKAISNVFVLLFLMQFFFHVRLRKLSTLKLNEKILFFIAFGICISLCRAICNGYSISKDITAIIRSVFLGCAAFYYSSSIKIDKAYLCKVIFYLWVGISLSIFLSWLFGIGIATYVEFNVGHKFYFQSVNELTFVYIFLWLWLIYFIGNFYIKTAITFYTILVFMIIGNKAFVPLMTLAVLFIVWDNFCVKRKIMSLSLIVSAIFLLVLTGLLNEIVNEISNYIAFFLVHYSLGGSKLAAKLNHIDTISALVSQRDILWGYSIDLFKNSYDCLDIIFGRSFSGYGISYGHYKNSLFSFAENDILDIFMSYGIIGFIGLYYMIKKLWCMNIYGWGNRINKVAVFMFIVTGFMTGHVMLFSFPVFLFSYLLGTVYDVSKKNIG